MSQCWLAAEPVKWIIAQKSSKFACELAPSTVYLLCCSVDVVRLHCWLTENHPEGKTQWEIIKLLGAVEMLSIRRRINEFESALCCSNRNDDEDFVIEKRNMYEVWAGWVMASLISDRTEHHRNVIKRCVIRPNKMVRNLQKELSRLCSEESRKKLVFSTDFDWWCGV